MKWEKLGTLALLPHTCMTSPDWKGLVPGVWRLVAQALGVQRLARQAPVANTGRPPLPSFHYQASRAASLLGVSS